MDRVLTASSTARRLCSGVRIVPIGWNERSEFQPLLSNAPAVSFDPVPIEFVTNAPCPIWQIETKTNISVKCRILPIRHPPDVPVLHRIVENVINMPLIIQIVADGMFPVAALPDLSFSLAYPGRGPSFDLRKCPGERDLDQELPRGDIITFG